MAKPIAKNQTELASLLGVSQPVVSGMLRSADCPVPQRGPWTEAHLKSMNDWRSLMQEDRSQDVDTSEGESFQEILRKHPAKAVEVRLKMERMQKVRLERLILEGSYIPKDEVLLGWSERARFFRESMEGLAAAVSSKCVGLKAIEIQKVIEQHHNDLLDSYQQEPLPGIPTS